MATLPSSTRINTITLASASAGPFSVGFRLFRSSAIEVFLNNDLVDPSDYTVTASFSNGYTDSATITFDTSLSASDVVMIVGDMEPLRGDDYLPTDSLLTKKQNVELGQVWATLADLRRNVKASLRTFTAIPPIVPEPDSVLGTNSSGGFGFYPRISLFTGAGNVDIPTDHADLDTAFTKEGAYGFAPNASLYANFEAGEQPEAGATISGGDWSNMRVISDDAEVSIGAGFPATDPFLMVENAMGPRFDTLINMGGLGNNGIELLAGGKMVFAAGSGIKNAGANGDDPNGAAILVNGGEAHVDYDAAESKGIIVDGAARRGLWVTISGVFSGKFGSYRDIGTDPSISEGNSAVLISRNGSWYDDNVTMTGSVRGIRNGGGEGQVRDGNLSGIDGTGIWNFFYGVTKTEQTDFSETGWHGAWSVYGANYSSRLDISDQETAITSVEFDSTGYRMSIMGTVADALIEYVLVTAYDQEVGRETTTLAEGIDDSVTSFDVANAARLPSVVDFVIQIGSERMLVTGVSGNTLTVTREVDGTTPAEHSNGATVQLYGTTLNGAINDSVTSVQVNDASILPPAAAGEYLLTIGSERVLVTGVSGNTLTVTRNADGTSPATHSDNDAVSIYVKSQSVAAKEATPTGHTWGDSGDHVYIVGTSSDQVHQYSVSTAYDLTSTFSFVGSFSFSAQTGSAQAIRFNAAGTAMFIASGANIFEYTLSTGWDVTSASYTATHDFSAIVTDIRGFDFGDSGNRLFIADQDTDRLDQYELASAYTLTGFTWDKYDYLKSPGSNNGLTAGSVSGFCFPTENRFFFCGDASGTDSVFRYETWDYSVLYVGGPQGDQAQGGGVIIADRPTFDNAKWTLAEVDTPQGSIAMEDVVSATGLMGPVATITGGEVTAPGSAFYASANSKAPHMVLISDFGKFEGTGCTLDGSGVVPYLVAVTEGGRAFLRGARLKAPGTKMFDFRAGGGSIYLHDNIINDVENCFPNGVWLGDNAVFSTFAEAELAISLGFNLANGKTFSIGRFKYEFDDTAGDPISRLPGVKPAGIAYPNHWAVNALHGVTDMTDALGEYFAYSGEKGARNEVYAFDEALTIADNTTIASGRLKLKWAGAGLTTLLTIGDNFSFDKIELDYGTALGCSGNSGANFTGDHFYIFGSVESDATFWTGTNEGLDVNHLQSFKATRPFVFTNVTSTSGGRIGFVDIDTFIRGLSLTRCDDIVIEYAHIRNRATNAAKSPGHNAILIDDCNRGRLGEADLHDAGEHNFRVGGAGGDDWQIGSIRGGSSGGCHVKINATSSVVKGWSIGEVINLADASSDRNDETARISGVENFQIGTIMSSTKEGATYGPSSLLALNGVDGLLIGKMIGIGIDSEI